MELTLTTVLITLNLLFGLYILVSRLKQYKSQCKELVGYVSSLRVHPLKSGGIVKLDNAVITKYGVQYDRHYVLAQDTGTFINLSKHPKLLLVRQTIQDDSLLLEADGMEPLKLPLVVNVEEHSILKEIKILRASTDGVHISKEADKWFAKYLDIEGHKLYCFPKDGVPRYTKDKGKAESLYCTEEDMCKFANGSPLLVVSQGSVDKLNEDLEEKIDADRFRPNIVITGCPPNAEDEWDRIEIGDTQLKCLYPCARCPSTTINTSTGVINNNEPLQTLTRIKPASSEKYPLLNHRPIFGCNYGVRRQGSIKIGDPVYIVK